MPQTGCVTGSRQRRPEDSARAVPIGSMEAVTGIRRWIVLSVLCVSLLLISLDTTVLNVAMPTIVRSLNATSSQLQWMVDAYAVVFAGLLLTLGSLGDRVGRKWVFLAGLVVFAAGSAGSAFSGTPDRLVVARACMGIGAAGIMPSTLSILSNVLRKSGTGLGPSASGRVRAGMGVATGPIVGGWLLAHFWWGSVFLINVPIAVLGLIAAAFLVPNSRNMAARRSDPSRCLLSVRGWGGCLGIIEAPSRTWTSLLVLGALGVASSSSASSSYWELIPTTHAAPRASSAPGTVQCRHRCHGARLVRPVGDVLLPDPVAASLSATARSRRSCGSARLLLRCCWWGSLSSVLARFVGTKPVVVAGMALIAVGLGLLSRTTVDGGYPTRYPFSSSSGSAPA